MSHCWTCYGSTDLPISTGAGGIFGREAGNMGDEEEELKWGGGRFRGSDGERRG